MSGSKTDPSVNSQAPQRIEVDLPLTRKVAHLARLALTENEAQTFTHQLNKILRFVEELQEVDVNNTEPLTRPIDLATPLREDELRPSNLQLNPGVLETAPDLVENGFKVPSVL